MIWARHLKLVTKLGIAALALVALAASGNAQDAYKGKFTLPFETHWGSVTLPAGDYSFRVQGATSRGTWSEPGATVRIEILPPFWGTWWFLSACGIFVLFSLWLAYRIRLR